MKYLFLFIAALIFLPACNAQQTQKGKKVKDPYAKLDAEYPGLDKATFAGGCFWCVEAVFERVEGVKDAISGYAGGPEKNPTYEQVAAGKTGHAEAVLVYFDPQVVSFSQLLKVFFLGAHDPTQLNRQGPDIGKQYRSAVYYHTEEQRELTESYIEQLEAEGRFEQPIVTEVAGAGPFYVAEDYHQGYYELHPLNPYVMNVSRPKVEKFVKDFPELLKEKYRSRGKSGQ
jgi:peptide-methionine (S)-S-oxide reductase